MHLHLKNLNPETHGLIKQHQAEEGLKNLDETIEYIVWLATIEYPRQIKVLKNK